MKYMVFLQVITVFSDFGCDAHVFFFVYFSSPETRQFL
jgi:hypothetical protein